MNGDGIPLAPEQGFTLPGPLGEVSSNPNTTSLLLTGVISTAIGVMTVIAFIWFIIQFFIAAVQIIGSGGDKNALASAKSKLTTSLIGLVIVVSAVFLIELVGTILGISILDSIVTFLL